MAVFSFTDGVVVINSVDLSDHVKSAELTVEADDLETTAMGSTYRSRIGGLKQGTLALTFNQDFASGEVDATLFSALGTVVTFSLKATSSATSATNPAFTGSVLITEYAPLSGSVGDLAEVSVSWPTTGTVTRSTS